jgi:hypothetical protein
VSLVGALLAKLGQEQAEVATLLADGVGDGRRESPNEPSVKVLVEQAEERAE